MTYNVFSGTLNPTQSIPSLTVLVAISKGMQAVKLLQQNPPVLSWGAG